MTQRHAHTRFKGTHVAHELMIQDGKLFAAALEDGVLTTDPLCFLKGNWLTGDEDKAHNRIPFQAAS